MTDDSARLPGSAPFGWLPAALGEPRRPLRAILAGWASAFLPSLPLAWASQSLFPALDRPSFEFDGALALALLVGFAPLVETVIMAAALTLLRLVFSPTITVLVSSAGWGIAHSLAAPAWGLVIWWPFLVFSALFLVWRQRGWWPAVALVAAVHALHNLIPALILVTRG